MQYVLYKFIIEKWCWWFLPLYLLQLLNIYLHLCFYVFIFYNFCIKIKHKKYLIYFQCTQKTQFCGLPDALTNCNNMTLCIITFWFLILSRALNFINVNVNKHEFIWHSSKAYNYLTRCVNFVFNLWELILIRHSVWSKVSKIDINIHVYVCECVMKRFFWKCFKCFSITYNI